MFPAVKQRLKTGQNAEKHTVLQSAKRKEANGGL